MSPPDQNDDTQISYLVAHLGKKGLDLRVDRRALDPDTLSEATDVVYRSVSGVRTRDGYKEVQVRTPSTPVPSGYSLYQAFGTGEGLLTPSGAHSTPTGRWPTMRGMVDGPNAPWAWTGDHLVSAPGSALPQAFPADNPRLFLPKLSELVPAARLADQAAQGLQALSVDTAGGPSLLWLVTSTGIEAWEVELDEAGHPGGLVTRRFTIPATPVTQIRALCLAGVHYMFYVGGVSLLLEGYRWFQGEAPPTQVYVDGPGVTAFDVIKGAAGKPYLALAQGTALSYIALDPMDATATLNLTASQTVVEMAVAYEDGYDGSPHLVWAVTDQVTNVQIHTAAGWYTHNFESGFGDGLALALDPSGTLAWVWCGRSTGSGANRFSDLHYLAAGVWTYTAGAVPDSRPESGGFMVGETPACWMGRPKNVAAVTNPVGWLLVGQTRHDAAQGTFSCGGTAYPGYGFSGSRVVLAKPVPVDPVGPNGHEVWTFAQASTAFKFQAGLFASLPGFVSPPAHPLTSGDGPATVLTLDFSESGAALSQARLGGAVYLAGAQPHGFDGRQVYEAGFNGYPVCIGETVASGVFSSSLDNGDLRQYRAYLVWRNAAGELMYSDANVYQSVAAAVAAPQAQRTLTFSFSCPASELYGKAWVEVYATTGATPSPGVAGPVFYQIVSEGNGVYLYPGGPTFGLTFQVVDSTPDAELASGDRAQDPYNPSVSFPFNLAPGPWPACDSVAMAGDRLFLAGGLVQKGCLSFTKLRSFGVAAEHTDAYGLLEVSSQEDPVEWVTPFQDSVIAVAGGSVFVFGGTGPDNEGLGSFSAAVRITGGVTGVKRSVLSDEGVWLMSLSGCLLIGPGMTPQDVSAAITPALSAELGLGDVLYAEYDAKVREVRWFMTTGTVFVLDRNIEAPRWAVWRLPRVVGGSQGAALLLSQDGRWLDVTPGYSSDAGQPIQACVATADLTPVEGGWVKFRHWLVVGKWLASNTQGKVTVTAHYDGADYHTTLFWTKGPDNTRPLDQWFGRAVSETQDGLLYQRNRFARQRGSSVRLRFVVTGAPALLSQVTVDVTQPNGLARRPAK